METIQRIRRWLMGRASARTVKLPCGYQVIIDAPDEYIQGEIIAHGVYEPGIIRVLSALLDETSLFIDVGANIGHHTLVAAARGATICAFEPVPRLNQRVRDHVKLNRLEKQVEVVEAAMSNETGTAVIYVADRSDDGSHSLIPGVAAKSTTEVTVRTATLDSEMKRRGGRMPDVIKMDVEGFEARVLDGATDVLDAPQPPVWLFETADRLADTIGESARSVATRFTSRGYNLWSVNEETGEMKAVSAESIPSDLANYLAVHPRARNLHKTMANLKPFIT